jgi:hypothetical protein
MTGFRTDAKTMEQQERLLRVLATPEEFKRADEEWERERDSYIERIAQLTPGAERERLVRDQIAHMRIQPTREVLVESARRARELATVAFYDILFFFGVLLVGFAYLWKRGDLNWVRSLAAQREG